MKCPRTSTAAASCPSSAARRARRGSGSTAGTPRTRAKRRTCLRSSRRRHRYKLYRGGNLYDYAADPDETKLLDAAASPDAAAARKQLQAVLDQYRDARPAKLTTPPKKKDKE